VIKGIHHISISTPNLERIVGFYQKLGFELVKNVEWQPNSVTDRISGLQGASGRVAMLRAGNVYLEFIQYYTPEARPHEVRQANDPGYTHICFEAVDIDKEYDRMKAAGMVFTGPPVELGVGCATTYGRDPDGNIIELHEIFDDRHAFALERVSEPRGDQVATLTKLTV